MAIDHGLQGKNSSRSREKRAKKALKNKAIAMAALVGGKKKEVIFNEEKRAEWLTGFRKRKQERRTYGLAMQVLKDKKLLRENKKDKNSCMFTDLETQKDEEIANVLATTATEYSDEATRSMFGGDVSVVVDSGIADTLEERAHPDLAANMKANGNSVDRTKSQFEKAIAKAKQKLNASKKSKRNIKSSKYDRNGLKSKFQRSSAATKLLHKALGGGALGSNTYKGKSNRKK